MVTGEKIKKIRFPSRLASKVVVGAPENHGSARAKRVPIVVGQVPHCRPS
jgi:hypothetical protein